MIEKHFICVFVYEVPRTLQSLEGFAYTYIHIYVHFGFPTDT